MSEQKKKHISGFSKLSKMGKLRWVAENFFRDPEAVFKELRSYWHQDEQQQKVLDSLSENTLSNFPMPFGVAPNFLINDRTYTVPMVIEESSVVAAASAAAKYWMTRGGFRAEVLSTRKEGQVHFLWQGDFSKLEKLFPEIESQLIDCTSQITANMRARGGGVLNMQLLDFSDQEPHYRQLRVQFETCDSMGANFINTVLEEMAQGLEAFAKNHPDLHGSERDLQIVMAILSNYTPDCLVRASVSSPIEKLGPLKNGASAEALAQKFYTAVRIAQIDPYRATTHNKGIFNGIDAVVLATGNDFRAVEACGHAYAARDGRYRSLSSCSIEDGMFTFELKIPLALGTVGGLTKLHPLAKRSLEMLGNPSATELMEIVASVGLAQNFAALRSLVTTGIQHGHMRMHLNNILLELGANKEQEQAVFEHFKDKVVSYSAVRDFLNAWNERINKI